MTLSSHPDAVRSRDYHRRIAWGLHVPQDRRSCACGCGAAAEPFFGLYAAEACRDKVLTWWDAWVASGVILRPLSERTR